MEVSADKFVLRFSRLAFNEEKYVTVISDGSKAAYLSQSRKIDLFTFYIQLLSRAFVLYER